MPPIQNWHVDGTMVSECKNPCLSTKVNILIYESIAEFGSDPGDKDNRGTFLSEYDKV